MHNPAAAPSQVVIPRLEQAPDGSIRVVRWGLVLGQVLRPGDRIVAGGAECPVVVLVPRGRGRPMLALRDGHRFLALPGRVPASPQRWTVACGVAAVERDLERGAPGAGRQHVQVAAVAADGSPVAQLPDGLQGGLLDARQLDALCIRAATAPARHGLRVAVAVGGGDSQARGLLAGTPPGCLRFALVLDPHAPAQGQVIAGPWPGTSGAPTLRPRPVGAQHQQVPLPFGFDTRSTA